MPFNVRIYTHNIRYARKEPVNDNEKLWPDRKHAVVASILLHTGNDPSAIVGLQEVLYEQLMDILELLGSEWSYVGVGRDDGIKAGEFSPVLYRPSFYRAHGQPFWLSPTPSKPSKGWDAALKRVVMQVHFTAIDHQHQFIVYCTHFDNSGSKARAESAKLIIRLIGDQNGPQFVFGDLNSQPDEEPYRTLAHQLTDAELAPVKYGHSHTYTSFGEEPHSRIDYIFASHGTPLLYGVLHSEFKYLFSDHRPVVADFKVDL